MRPIRKSIYFGVVLAAPFILSTGIARANSRVTHQPVKSQFQRKSTVKHVSQQQIANNQYRARQNGKSQIQRYDSSYWTNRTNLAAYQRKNYHFPTINWNARDLGGYYAGPHRWTKTGVVFRGGDLHNISKRGVNQLKQKNIDEVIDLRSYHHQGGADPGEAQPNQSNPLHVKYMEDVVNTRADKRAIAPYKRMYGGELYKYATSFLTWRDARNAYHDVFMHLLNHKTGGIYFHCIDGDDRTGIMSILYLASLGVSKWNIYNDYLLTNYYHHKTTYNYKAKEIDRFYWGIRYYYGTMNNYLTSSRGVGLTKGQIAQMRKKYLVNHKG